MITSKPLLESVVTITGQKEEGTLAKTLTHSLYDLLNMELVALVKLRTLAHRTLPSLLSIKDSDSDDQRASTDQVLSDFSQQLEKVQRFSASNILYGNDCIKTVVPVLNVDSSYYVLCLKTKAWDQHYDHIISGITRVFSNYLEMLYERGHDALTGLYNRQFLHDHINRVKNFSSESLAIENVEYDRREDTQDEDFWLCIIDIDEFKTINRSFSHLYGDEVIVQIAELMKESFRGGDLLCRYGGGEFIVVFGPCSRDNATMVMERFRNKVANQKFGRLHQVTVSMGMVKVSEDERPSTLIGHADQALDYSKEHGRNQLSNYDDLTYRHEVKLIETQTGPESS